MEIYEPVLEASRNVRACRRRINAALPGSLNERVDHSIYSFLFVRGRPTGSASTQEKLGP